MSPLPKYSLTNQCSEISSGKRRDNFFLFPFSISTPLPLPGVRAAPFGARTPKLVAGLLLLESDAEIT